jgi:hypothetical protein
VWRRKEEKWRLLWAAFVVLWLISSSAWLAECAIDAGNDFGGLLGCGELKRVQPNFARFSSLLGCISDTHSSKTKIVVRALAICVCSLFAAALVMSIKTARGGLEVGAIWTPAPEIDPPPKTAVLKKLFAGKLCSYLAVSKFVS